jgi:hypothetical protein
MPFDSGEFLTRRERARLEEEGRIPAPARDQDRQVLVRLDWGTYQRLSVIAELRGVAPSTMARMLLRRGLHAAWQERIAENRNESEPNLS